MIAWDHPDDSIIEVLADLGAAMTSFRVVQLHLTGDLERGLMRASAREDAGWLDRSITKTNAYPGCHATVDSIDDLIHYLECAASRQRELLTRAPWPVIEPDADNGADATEAAAIDAIARLEARSTDT